MIKCEVTKLCAVIDRQAQVKQGKDGHSFLSFVVKLTITGRDGSKAVISVTVSVNGDESQAGLYYTGRRVLMSGTLIPRKKGDTVFFNLRAEHVEFVSNAEDDTIEGDMHFQGKTGKDRPGKPAVEQRTDKKGNTFLTFPAYSSERDGEGREYLWVRFLDFSPENSDFVQAGTFIDVKGTLQIGVYNNKPDFGCIVREIQPWVVKKEESNETEQ